MTIGIFSAIYPGTPPSKKLGGLPFSLSMTIFVLGMTLMAPCVRAQTSNSTTVQESNIPPPPEENPGEAPTILQIQAAVRANPKKAASILSRALEAEQSHTITFAAQAVTASIRGLGAKAKRVAVGRIILATVKSRPEAVLEIVRQAFPQTSKTVHTEIVAASASGILRNILPKGAAPNPNGPFFRYSLIPMCNPPFYWLYLRTQDLNPAHQP